MYLHKDFCEIVCKTHGLLWAHEDWHQVSENGTSIKINWAKYIDLIKFNHFNMNTFKNRKLYSNELKHKFSKKNHYQTIKTTFDKLNFLTTHIKVTVT